MKVQRKPLTMIGLIWAFVSLPFAQGRVNAAAPQFDKIVEDYFAARFEYRPSEGTAAGLHEYDHRLEDLSEACVIRRIEELSQFKRRLAALKRDMASQKAKLPDDDEIDLIFLQWQVEAELIDLNVLREWARNPMGYSTTRSSRCHPRCAPTSRRHLLTHDRVRLPQWTLPAHTRTARPRRFTM
jgi:hypothetical protein